MKGRCSCVPCDYCYRKQIIREFLEKEHKKQQEYGKHFERNEIIQQWLFQEIKVLDGEQLMKELEEGRGFYCPKCMSNAHITRVGTADQYLCHECGYSWMWKKELEEGK